MSPAKINCIIIEDELPASILLEMHISKLHFLSLKGKFMSVASALNTLKTQKIDLIFLDINLPGKSGIDFARTLPDEIGVIFTTAYAEHAIDGFDLEAVDYILKPVSFERFSKAVNKYCKIQTLNEEISHSNLPETERPFVFVKCERKMLKLFLDEIDYFESQGNYLLIHTGTDRYKTHQSLAEMEDKLPEGLFCRIHRSFLIAINKVNRFNSSSVSIQNKELPIGRLYSASTTGMLQKLIKK